MNPSNQILQNTVEGLTAITKIELCVMDTEGKVLATNYDVEDELENFVLDFVHSPAESQVIHGYQFFKVFDELQLEYTTEKKGRAQ